MNDLRNHLFEVMEALKDDEKPMELARAKAVVDVAQALINSAKVEVEFLEAIDSCETTEFFGARRDDVRRLEPVTGMDRGQRRLAS
jgi:hypothetical protein